MREFLPLAVAFTIGVLVASVRYEREEADLASASADREMKLQIEKECAYHEGLADGRNQAACPFDENAFNAGWSAGLNFKK